MPQVHNPITSPSHYTAYDVQPIEITRHLGFCMGNVVKYVLRAPYKGNPVQDLQKALQYLEWEKEAPFVSVSIRSDWQSHMRPRMNRPIIIKKKIAALQKSLASHKAQYAVLEAVIAQTTFFLVDLHDYLFVWATVDTLNSMAETIQKIVQIYEIEEPQRT